MKRYTLAKNVNIFLFISNGIYHVFFYCWFFFHSDLAYCCFFSGCDLKFRRSDYRSLHIRKMHPEVIFECFVCKLRFHSFYELSRHMQRDLHDSLESSIQITTANTLETNENNEEPNVCVDCGKIFAKKQQLYDHRRFHKMEGDLCRICSKTFTHPNSYREHMLIHEGKVEHFCSTCGKGFVLRRRLRAHEGLFVCARFLG